MEPKKPINYNALYRHYKNGKLYRVIAVGNAEANGGAMVAYEDVVSQEVYMRPLMEFWNLVEHEGRTVWRFHDVGDLLAKIDPAEIQKHLKVET